MPSLNKQLHGYSVGLTAYYAALLRHRPSAFLGLLRLLPMAGGYLRGREEASGGAPGIEDPSPEPPALVAELDRRALQGMLNGPRAYLRSRRVQRRVAAAARPR
jgi:hypothetical protein